MKKSLLYLEDDESLAQMTSKAFVRRGFNVCHFKSIEEFKKNQNHSGSPFTHALLDMRLEDGNSLALISELSQKDQNLKIILLTGYASIATAVQAIKLGAYNYLPKPATIDEILSAFNEQAEIKDTAIQTMSLKRIEWEKIQQALADNNGNITLTAKQLNMHRRTLQRKLSKRPVLN